MTARALATLFVAAAAALPAGFASAETAPVRSTVAFWLLDRDGDGAVEAAEIEALRAVVFDAMDADGDGRLTRAEAEAVAAAARMRAADRLALVIKAGPRKLAERQAEVAAAFGLDQPGGVSRDQFVARDGRLAAEADRDGDGRISAAEFAGIANLFGTMLSGE